MSTKKLTNAIFIERAISIHGDKYDYSNCNYVNSLIKVNVICNLCLHLWAVIPGNHIGPSKAGCPNCKQINHQDKMNKNILTTEEFIKRSSIMHNNKFDYTNTLYTGSKNKVTIRCHLHGEFEQWPQDHMRGIQCPECSGFTKWTTERFIDKIKEISPHLDLSSSIYINSTTKIKFICVHGENFANPQHLLNGTGCRKCGIDTAIATKIKNGTITDPINKSEYELYRLQVWAITNEQFHKHYHKINPENITRGLQNHLDHKYSIQQGFHNKISAEIIGSWINLRLLPHKENRSKTNRCLYTIDELTNYYNLSLLNDSFILDDKIVSLEELPKVPHKKRTPAQNAAQSARQKGKKLSKHSAEANAAKSKRMKGRVLKKSTEPLIVCGDVEFPSCNSAAKYFSIDVTTVYNRIKDDKFKKWYRL